MQLPKYVIVIHKNFQAKKGATHANFHSTTQFLFCNFFHLTQQRTSVQPSRVTHWKTVSMERPKLSKLVMPQFGPSQNSRQTWPASASHLQLPPQSVGSSSSTISPEMIILRIEQDFFEQSCDNQNAQKLAQIYPVSISCVELRQKLASLKSTGFKLPVSFVQIDMNV